MPAPQTPLLVSVEWLAENLKNPQLRLIDCRWVLGQPGEGRRRYDEAHIPGAIHIDVDTQLSGRPETGPGRHPLPPRRQFSETMSEVGIQSDTHVIIYDEGQGMPAARLWWLLYYYGHENVSLLDGGWSLWTKAGLPTSQEVPVPLKTTFNGRPRKKLVLNRQDVDQVRDQASDLLLDARASERYSGKEEPIDSRAGHIPGAVNLPYLQLIDPQTGKFLKPEKLQEEFQKVGSKEASNIICYCGSGVTACTLLFGLKMIGKEGKLYEGSWSDWASDKNLPAATS